MKIGKPSKPPVHGYGLLAEAVGNADEQRPSSIHIDITLRDEIIGSFDRPYGQPYRGNLAVTTVKGRDFGIIASEYYRVGIISLPDCTRTFETNPAIWNEDHVPLGFWTDERIPGLVFVAWMAWGDPEYKAMATYFWVDGNGQIASPPKCIGEFAEWPNEVGSIDHLFEFVDVELVEGKTYGWLNVKTNTRRELSDLIYEQRHFLNLDSNHVLEDNSR